LGADGHFTFKISDLLANDPGGAAKVDVTKQFFFGDTAADQANQAQYLLDHGIHDNGDGTYTLTNDATDFHYFVQIGNKGTWSQAAVDVTAPVDTHHAGALLFNENFDSYSLTDDHGSWGVANLGTGGWANPVAGGGWTGATDELLKSPVLATTGTQSLDTQNSPGRIDIFNHFDDPTGGKAQLSFDIAKQNWGAASTTDPNAAFQIKIDGTVVKEIHANDLAQLPESNHMYHFDVVFDTGAAPGGHLIELVDVTPGANDHSTGFSVDTIQIHDWIV
jgi:hypothetical protein